MVSLGEINSQISFMPRSIRTSHSNLSNRMFDLLLHQIFVEFLSCSQAANFWYFWPPLNFALVYSLMRRMSNIIYLVLSCFQPACPYSCSSGMSQHILWFNRQLMVSLSLIRNCPVFNAAWPLALFSLHQATASSNCWFSSDVDFLTP